MEEWKDVDRYPNYEISNFGRVKTKKTGRIKAIVYSKKGYSRVHLSADRKGRLVNVHRLVACAFIDNPENLPQIDHIDDDKRNNHVSNLRWCSQSNNIHCRPKIKDTTQSNLVGVHFNPGMKRKKRWTAQINHQKISYRLGYFLTEEDAARAYDAKATELYGKFARLNFPV
jgi:hypothetical protein